MGGGGGGERGEPEPRKGRGERGYGSAQLARSPHLTGTAGLGFSLQEC